MVEIIVEKYGYLSGTIIIRKELNKFLTIINNLTFCFVNSELNFIATVWTEIVGNLNIMVAGITNFAQLLTL